MKCFYHPDNDSVGICQECGKSACRTCIEDVGGAMLCKSCLDRALAEHAQELKHQEEQQNALAAHVRATAAKRLRWSYIVALLSGVFFAWFAMGAAHDGARLPLPGFLFVPFGVYVVWSIYWGLVWFWPKWRSLVERLKQSLAGWFLIARLFTWFIILIFYVSLYLSVPFAVAVYYGVFGGAIFQFLKHLRIVRRGSDVNQTGKSDALKAVSASLILLGVMVGGGQWTASRQMRATVSAASLGNGATTPVTWAELSPGEAKSGYSLGTDRRLLYRGVPFKGFSIAKEAAGAWISSASPQGYVFCITEEDTWAKGIVINLNSMSGYVALDGSRLPIGFDAVQWASWSPGGGSLLAAHYHEAHPELYFINIGTRTVKRIPIKLASPQEEQVYVLDSLQWNSARSFSMKVTISCNAYTVASCNDTTRKTILRAYIVLVDVPTLVVRANRTKVNGPA